MAYIGKVPTAVPLTSADIQDGTIALADLSATGTKDSTTFLRGDNTFASAGGTNTPSFEAFLTADQSYTDNVETKVQFNSEVFDSDGCYDNSTNYRFTPTTAGKYYVYAQVVTDVTDLTNKLYTAKISIYKNGSTYKAVDNMPDYSSSSGWDILTQYVFATVVMNGSSDYLEIYAKANGDQNGNFRGNATLPYTNFGAYKIIE